LYFNLLCFKENNIMMKVNSTGICSPFFSVVIATYNRAELLKRAIESLIKQTEKDWEAIVVDDGSEDDTEVQILPYLSMNKNVKYFKKEHSGVSLTKNKGVHLSKGQFITFLDSDDTYAPNHLESRKQLLLKDETIEFLYGGLNVLGSQYVPNRFNYLEKVHLNSCVAGGTFFVKRETILSLNGYKEMPIAEDADLLDRAKRQNVKIQQTAIPTYNYHRDNPDALTHNFYNKMKTLNNKLKMA